MVESSKILIMCCAAHVEAGEQWRAIAENKSYTERGSRDVKREGYRPLPAFRLPPKLKMTSLSGRQTRIVHNKNNTAYWMVKGHDAVDERDKKYSMDTGESDVVVVKLDFDGMLNRCTHPLSTWRMLTPSMSLLSRNPW
jgi:hypothetical protein